MRALAVPGHTFVLLLPPEDDVRTPVECIEGDARVVGDQQADAPEELVVAPDGGFARRAGERRLVEQLVRGDHDLVSQAFRDGRDDLGYHLGVCGLLRMLPHLSELPYPPCGHDQDLVGVIVHEAPVELGQPAHDELLLGEVGGVDEVLRLLVGGYYYQEPAFDVCPSEGGPLRRVQRDHVHDPVLQEDVGRAPALELSLHEEVLTAKF